MYLLIKASADYADEFDCKCIAVTTIEAWNNVKELAKERFEEENGEVSRCFGTNEELVFESYEDWLDCFTEFPISEETAKELWKIFPPQDDFADYGTGHIFDI